MLHILPVELSLSVLSYLPLQTLSSLPALSRQWFDFISANQSTIFCNAAILHGYAHPGTLLLEDTLSAYKGSPWDGTTDWKDFCKSGSPVVVPDGLFRAPPGAWPLGAAGSTVLIFVGRRSFQLRKNWEGNGRVVARLVTPAGSDVHRIKVDEKFGICITTRMLGGLAVTHLFTGTLLWSLPLYYVRSRAHCEYENGYLIFDRLDNNKEVWRLVSDDDSAVDGGNDCDVVVAAHAPPDEAQRRVSAVAATMHRRYAPRGHFRPWAKLTFPETTHAYRFAYPTLLCANQEHAFLHDVRTGALVQTIDLDLLEREKPVYYVDVNDRHAFVCDPEELHVFARHGDEEAGTAAGAEVLRIPRTTSVTKAAELVAVHGNAFFAALPLRRDHDVFRPQFVAAHVSRDGRDLAIIASRHRVLLIRDFQRLCRGETSIDDAGQVLHLLPGEECYYLAFEHGRVCVATLHGLYIVNVDGSDSIDSTKVVLVQPYLDTPGPHHDISCMQLTDRRIYFTWEDARRRDVPLFEDERDVLEPSSPVTPSLAEQLGEPWPWVDLEFDPQEGISVGCIDFSLMPEN